jgi:hypothetical protein
MRGRFRCDSELMATRQGRAALRLLSEPHARACCQLVRLHSMGNWRPTRRNRRVVVSGSRHVVRFASWSETESAHANDLLIVQGGDWSCEAKTGRARQRLVVRGGDFSEGLPIVGNLSKKLPTSREQDVLPVMVMTGVLSPPRLESWPSRCQWCQILHLKSDYLAIKGGPNLGPRQISMFYTLQLFS